MTACHARVCMIDREGVMGRVVCGMCVCDAYVVVEIMDGLEISRGCSFWDRNSPVGGCWSRATGLFFCLADYEGVTSSDGLRGCRVLSCDFVCVGALEGRWGEIGVEPGLCRRIRDLEISNTLRIDETVTMMLAVRDASLSGML